MSKGFVDSNPHIKYVDVTKNGYIMLQITRQHVTSSWYHIDSVSIPTTDQTLARQYRLTLDQPGLKRVDAGQG